jgi:hypothetical protein
VLVLQEVTPAILESISTILPSHDHVVDVSKQVEWTTEGNIFWNRDLFSMLGQGALPLESADNPHRCLFWVRLALKCNPKITAVYATCHLPWVGSQTEISTGMNPRIPASLKIVAYLKSIVAQGEPAILAGTVFSALIFF